MSNEIKKIIESLNTVLLGKEEQVKLALSCVLAQGHLLLDDIPGVGKTMLAHALAVNLGLQFKRVQFTNDMLPSDLLGVSIFNKQENAFVFQPGPIFNQFLLADEINRASPKVQSALLEAMEEKQVSVDGKTYKFNDIFIVVATQNPVEQLGTFQLPESQLDRFLMRISLGYPHQNAEKNLLKYGDRRGLIRKIEPVLDKNSLMAMQQVVARMQVGDAIVDYIYRLVSATRTQGLFLQGLSPRGGIALVRAAKAKAFVEGRDFILPEDVKEVFVPVSVHRLRTLKQGRDTSLVLEDLLANVPVA